MGKVLAVMRAKEYSPGSVEKDEAIMLAVTTRLQARGYETEVVYDEQTGAVSGTFDIILSMARRPETLSWLRMQGTRCINSPDGVARCRRSVLQQVMASANVPLPPCEGSDGYWLKRGDTSVGLTKDDVVYAADEVTLQQMKKMFRQRGITDMVVSAHVAGDEIKFYGVRTTGFFRCYYPADDGVHHYPFSVDDLHQTAERLAAAVGIDVYGGDGIVRQDGTFCIIDFNDWPSFSRCRDEAAEAIVRVVSSVEI